MPPHRQIIDDQLYAHFVTFAVFRRRRLLDHDHPKRILSVALNGELALHDAACAGFVVMPDHAHAILWFPKIGLLSRFMHGWKRKSGTVPIFVSTKMGLSPLPQTSFHFRHCYRRENARYFDGFGQGDRFWGTVPIFVSTKMGLSPLPQIMLDTNRLTQNFLQGAFGSPNIVHSRFTVERNQRTKSITCTTIRCAAGLVGRPTDWKWSSAQWCEWRRSVGAPVTCIE